MNGAVNFFGDGAARFTLPASGSVGRQAAGGVGSLGCAMVFTPTRQHAARVVLSTSPLQGGGKGSIL